MFFFQTIAVAEDFGKQKHEGACCYIECKVNLDISLADEAPDDSIVNDRQIESTAHDLETDKVSFGEETTFDDVSDYQYDTCSNREDC